MPARIKVPMKGSDTERSRDKKRGSHIAPNSIEQRPSSASAPPAPAPASSGTTHLSPATAAAPGSPAAADRSRSPAPLSPGPAAANATRPLAAAGSADLTLAITKIFEIVKQKAAKELRLSGKQLEKSHLKLIFDSLMQTNTVSHVELRQASLADEGASFIAKFIKSNKYPTLTSIDLQGNPFKPAALEELVDALSKNFYITRFGSFLSFGFFVS
jgi:hypothetical protein